ncbi:hypothetical protein [Burkholderia pseudomallei]|uniref:hypothetical protein n=1 Tax=Burkholderia pseudomallei TaxID=28450 RepID=UPI0012B0FC7C|nr:hypothetical protein [Burkholderia pseudomallei]
MTALPDVDELVASAAVRAENVDAERVDSDFFGIKWKFEVAPDAKPIHDDLLNGVWEPK